MIRKMEIYNEQHLLAAMELAYEKKVADNLSGYASVTLYETVPTGPDAPDSYIPVQFFNGPFEHVEKQGIDQFKLIDIGILWQLVEQINPDYFAKHRHQDLTVEYSNREIYTRYISLYQGNVTGIAQFTDNFTGNTCSVQYTSAVRTGMDRSVQTDRYSIHSELLHKLNDSEQVAWKKVP